jgi:hypothetical protein
MSRRRRIALIGYLGGTIALLALILTMNVYRY